MLTVVPLLGISGMSVLSAGVLGAPAGPSTRNRGALAAMPPAMLDLYVEASASCPGLPWEVLAAVGTVESANGTSDLPGVHSGSNGAGAEGPMQFEPATFARYDEPVPPGGASPPSPYDPVDAVYAAARMLCADGAGSPGGLGAAIYAYDHSGVYVAAVLATAGSYGFGAPGPGRAASIAVAYALAQVGTPYRWGGEAPGVGFDCSGLVQAAYAAAGVSLPRTAQGQYDAGPPLPGAAVPAAGDLVFFGPSPGVATHVGLVVGPAGGAAAGPSSEMVDAPHTGATVRVEAFPAVVGAAWGSDVYLGATDPASAIARPGA